jgi:hypothetical protein
MCGGSIGRLTDVRLGNVICIMMDIVPVSPDRL